MTTGPEPMMRMDARALASSTLGLPAGAGAHVAQEAVEDLGRVERAG